MKHIVFAFWTVCFFLFYQENSLKAAVVLSVERPNYVGELDQRNGVIENLKSLVPGIKIESIALNADTPTLEEIRKIEGLIQQTQEPIILLSGHTFGPVVFKQITQSLSSKKRQQLITCLTAHQLWKGWEDLSRKNVNFVALPRHIFLENPGAKEYFSATKEDSDKPYLIQTIGVSHSLSSKTTKETFQQHQTGSLRPWSEKKRPLLVVLGGDVQNKDGTWHLYSTEETKKLADLVALFMKEYNIDYVIITNGPRTGRIDSHTKSQDATSGYHHLDPVTLAFSKALEEKGISFQLENFVFGQPSQFPVLLGLLQKTGGLALIPGESTSMISQAIDCLPHGHIMIFNHSAMGSVHQHHVKSERKAGRAPYWEWCNQKWDLKQIEKNTKNAPHAGYLIAQVLSDQLALLHLNRTSGP